MISSHRTQVGDKVFPSKRSPAFRQVIPAVLPKPYRCSQKCWKKSDRAAVQVAARAERMDSHPSTWATRPSRLSKDVGDDLAVLQAVEHVIQAGEVPVQAAAARQLVGQAVIVDR